MDKEADVISRRSSSVSQIGQVDVGRRGPGVENSIVTPPEEFRLPAEWNRAEEEYARERCIHDLFREQARRTPDAVAVRFRAEELSYRELDRRSNGLAQHLRELGVGSETLVGICVERSAAMIVALLGVLKAGGAYVPLDPHHPPARLAMILEDAEAPFLLTEHALVACCPDFKGRQIFLEELISSDDNFAPVPEVSGSNAAYVIYTSGSTGRPKGVVIEHRSVVNLLHATVAWPGIRAEDVLVAIATITFDVSVVELFLPLSVGACLVIASQEVRGDSRALAALFEEVDATILFTTPATLQMLLHGEWKGSKKLRVMTGGEALSRDLADRILDRCCELWNIYGPTEATVWCTGTRVFYGEAITIGEPMANVQAYVMDSDGLEVPDGTRGELWLGGVGVARGYLRRPELTADRFVPDCFSPGPGRKLYKTGDLVSRRPDENIEYHGRIDFQVKIRGFRIELGEIEALLLAQPEVREATVVVRAPTPENQRLAAYLVGVGDARPGLAELNERLAKQLPEYMLPRSVAWLDRFPLTPNGKVDRKALAVLERETVAKREDSRPANPVEIELTRIWQRIFRTDNIGRQENFFSLGGNSILATQLVTEIGSWLDCRLHITELFESPTIESLAQRLSDKGWMPRWRSLVPLQAHGSKPPIFFVHGIEGDLYHFVRLLPLLGPDQPCYGVHGAGLDPELVHSLTIEEIAAHYAGELASFHKTGAFYLVGYSLGGMVAFEIAQQLRQLGREVAFLGLLDSWPMSAAPRHIYPLAVAMYLPGRCAELYQQWRTLPLRQKFSFVHERWENFVYGFLKRKRRAPAASPSPEDVHELKGDADPYVRASRGYHFKAYPGVLDIFVGDDTNFLESGLYWKHLADGISYHRIPGGHLEIFSQDNVAALARSLASAVRNKTKS